MSLNFQKYNKDFPEIIFTRYCSYEFYKIKAIQYLIFKDFPNYSFSYQSWNIYLLEQSSDFYSLIISIMNQRLSIAILLLMSIAVVSTAEWYEQGHQQHLLDWSNFDTATQQPGKFKFIKFFTRNCRYCRLLKQVEEQLREQKQWSFNFYAVDCSLHYDLCMAKAAMTAFPFVGIYNPQGALQGTIGGFYPLETMREAFNTIENWQVAEQLAHNGPQVVLPDPKAGQSHPVQNHKPETVSVDINPTELKLEISSKTQETLNQHTKQIKKENKKDDQSDQGWEKSIRDGIKLTIILLGVIIFNKTVSPYLLDQKEELSYSQSRTIEVPLYKPPTEQAKRDPVDSNKMISDSI